MGPPATPLTPNSRKRVTFCDLRQNRSRDAEESFCLDLTRCNWYDLHEFVIEKKKIPKGNFSLVLPDHIPLTEDKYEELNNSSTVWILDTIDQAIDKTVTQSVRIDPHYHTITQSGMYEYYDSRGIDSMVISLAELIDNSLAATKDNKGLRHIEIRYYDNASDSMALILDNGKGMDVNGLNDWARFKYSRFEREKNGSNSMSDISMNSTQDSQFRLFHLSRLATQKTKSRVTGSGAARPSVLGQRHQLLRRRWQTGHLQYRSTHNYDLKNQTSARSL